MNAVPEIACAPAPIDARAADILTRARQAFIDKGFDGASMQDLARAAGMSVGNFYRYFPSKNALVEALIFCDMRDMDADFAQVLDSPAPIRALRRLIRDRVLEDDRPGDGQLWAEITAAALRKPEIAAITRAMEERITGYLCAIFARATGRNATAPFAARARFLVCLVKAAGMLPRNDPTSPDVLALFLSTIDDTLAAIAPFPAEDLAENPAEGPTP